MYGSCRYCLQIAAPTYETSASTARPRLLHDGPPQSFPVRTPPGPSAVLQTSTWILSVRARGTGLNWALSGVGCCGQQEGVWLDGVMAVTVMEVGVAGIG